MLNEEILSVLPASQPGGGGGVGGGGHLGIYGCAYARYQNLKIPLKH